MEKELRQNEAALDGTADGMSEAAKGTDRLGDELKSTGKESDETGGKLENLGKVCTAVGVALTAALCCHCSRCRFCREGSDSDVR